MIAPHFGRVMAGMSTQTINGNPDVARDVLGLCGKGCAGLDGMSLVSTRPASDI